MIKVVLQISQLSLQFYSIPNILIGKRSYFYLTWWAILILLLFLLPGKTVYGTPVNEKGDRLKYKINGFTSFILILTVIGIAVLMKGFKVMDFFYDHYIGLLFVAYVYSVLQCTFLYIWSFYGNRQLAKGGNTGYHVYDFWMGRELNPRIGSFDFKQFNELRPGMILWAVLDIAFVC